MKVTGSTWAYYLVEEKEKRHKQTNIHYKLCSVSDKENGGRKPIYLLIVK